MLRSRQPSTRSEPHIARDQGQGDQGARRVAINSLRNSVLTAFSELQQDIDKDSAKYIRHSIRSSVPSSPSSRAPSPKSTALPAKIEAAYAEINQLSTEKVILSQTLIDLITRTRARLDSDLAKVRILQGETVDYASALERRLAASSIKLNASTPTKHRSASPTTTAPLATTQRTASRLSRQSITRQDTDMDEAEDDVEGEDGDGDDERLYCFCQKQSYGDMIACDNEGGCPYEWFHLSCVGMKQPTSDKWYCSSCEPLMGMKKAPAASTGRKGRKK
ncbi:hypothetical protein DXG03_000784 [Asterophora parasitica]|uniref:Chromatin modification-related protein n=1 Tax=Asterophora parasitica TaxID=117018 RepID=A0A9P7KF89_9AGAR|nr:hypothetical protein DXG03_000784 [Asterophora parasitica]